MDLTQRPLAKPTLTQIQVTGQSSFADAAADEKEKRGPILSQCVIVSNRHASCYTFEP